jgi:hypothetical protein
MNRLRKVTFAAKNHNVRRHVISRVAVNVMSLPFRRSAKRTWANARIKIKAATSPTSVCDIVALPERMVLATLYPSSNVFRTLLVPN